MRSFILGLMMILRDVVILLMISLVLMGALCPSSVSVTGLSLRRKDVALRCLVLWLLRSIGAFILGSCLLDLLRRSSASWCGGCLRARMCVMALRLWQ